MILLSHIAVSVLTFGGSLKIPAQGLLLHTMQQYAAAAKAGGAHVTFVVGDTMLLPDTMTMVASFGKGCVTFDFVSPVV